VNMAFGRFNWFSFLFRLSDAPVMSSPQHASKSETPEQRVGISYMCITNIVILKYIKYFI
jgi:hypothetical protein